MVHIHSDSKQDAAAILSIVPENIPLKDVSSDSDEEQQAEHELEQKEDFKVCTKESQGSEDSETCSV